MVEVRSSFGSIEEWEEFVASIGDFSTSRRAIATDVRKHGFIEPLSGIKRLPYEISIRDDNLHETLGAGGINSRKRALLAVIESELMRRGLRNNLSLRFLVTDALSYVALILRGVFPYLAGIEYGTPEKADRLFPIPCSLLEELEYPDASFDVIVTVDAMEHVSDVGAVMRELLRVLRPGGLLIVPLPFNLGRRESARAKSEVSDSEQTKEIADQGWDLIERLKIWGCGDAYCSIVASSHFGIAAEGKPGPVILVAQKATPGQTPPPRPRSMIFRGTLPQKLCVLSALPRSGTTLLTSLFAVHSSVEAVYEPWNGGRLPKDQESNIEALVKAEKLPSLQGKLLFVKETAAYDVYVDRIKALYDTAPNPIEKYFLLLLRKPEFTYLSEISRRSEWWNADVAVEFKSFEAWCEKSRRPLSLLISAALTTDGYVLTLEDIATRPEPLLRELCARLGLPFEREQLAYEKYLDTRKVRGDLNVSSAPDAIDLSKAENRLDQVAQIDGWLITSASSAWFKGFRALHGTVVAAGGLIAARDIPREIIAAVTGDGN